MESALERTKTNKTRLEYLTNVSVSLQGRLVSTEMKIDTGSAFTVFKVADELEKYSDYIMDNAEFIEDGGETASGIYIDIYKLVIQKFVLTPDIIIPNYVAYFSFDITKSLLGMDTLSLFQHAYRFEKNQLIGTYWLQDYEKSLERYKKFGAKVGCIDSRQIMALDKTKGRNQPSQIRAITIDEF